jgi:hypothetical protein
MSSNIGDDKDRIDLKTQKSTLSADHNITSAFKLLNGASASVIAGDWLLLEGMRAVDMRFVGLLVDCQNFQVHSGGYRF